MKLKQNLRLDTNLTKAGSFSTLELNTLDAAITDSYTVTFVIPGTANSVSLEAPWSSIEYANREVFINIVKEDERNLLNTSVELAVVYNEELVPEQIDEVIQSEDITSGEVARALVNQAGGTLYWDSALNYPVLSLLTPVKIYSGALNQVLDELLRPFNAGPVKIAEMIIDGTNITCLSKSTTSVAYNIIDLDISDGYWLEDVRIKKNSKNFLFSNIKSIKFLYHTAKDLQKITLYSKEDKKDGDENIIERKLTNTTMWGEFVTEETSETFERLPTWADSLMTQAQWSLVRTKYTSTTYEYDPKITSYNVHYIRSRKLTGKTETEKTYSNIGELSQTKTTTYTYIYDDDGYLKSETQIVDIRPQDATDSATVMSTITSYEQVSPDIYKVITETEQHTIIYSISGTATIPPPYKSGGDWAKIEDFTTESTYKEATIAGQAPRVPYLPAVYGEDRVETTEYTIDIQTNGQTVTIETEFDPTQLMSMYNEVYTKDSKWDVTLTAKSLYDIKPGTWINLKCTKAVNIELHGYGISATYVLGDILDLLPPLFVTSVELIKDSNEQTTIIRAEGWQ